MYNVLSELYCTTFVDTCEEIGEGGIDRHIIYTTVFIELLPQLILFSMNFIIQFSILTSAAE